jgi:intracellular multiplication protein IcmT
MTAELFATAAASGGERPAWSYTALRPKLWRLDARAVFPLGLWLLHWSWWTLAVAVAGVAALAAADWLGLPPEAALARLRASLVGPARPAADRTLWRRRSLW